MSHIIIRFIGLCIHIDDDHFPNLGAKHRVVFLSHDDRPIQGNTINPHQPVIVTPKPVEPIACVTATTGDEILQLNRVKLRVKNPRGGGFHVHDSYRNRIPHLTHRDQSLQPKEDVLLSGTPPAAAYFDTNDGELHACMATKDGAVGTWLKVETDGDPILEVSCIDSKESREWKLDHASVVEIYNTSEDGGDSEADYLINYQAFEPSLVTPSLPEPHDKAFALHGCFDPNEDPRLPLELTAACSNTGFP